MIADKLGAASAQGTNAKQYGASFEVPVQGLKSSKTSLTARNRMISSSFPGKKVPPDDPAELVLMTISQSLDHCYNLLSAWHDPSAAWLLGIKAEG